MKEILLSACGGWVTVNMVQLHLLIRANRKPMNCESCLAGWFCLAMTVQDYYWMDIPLMMAASMMVAAFYKYAMKKML